MFPLYLETKIGGKLFSVSDYKAYFAAALAGTHPWPGLHIKQQEGKLANKVSPQNSTNRSRKVWQKVEKVWSGSGAGWWRCDKQHLWEGRWWRLLCRSRSTLGIHKTSSTLSASTTSTASMTLGSKHAISLVAPGLVLPFCHSWVPGDFSNIIPFLQSFKLARQLLFWDVIVFTKRRFRI